MRRIARTIAASIVVILGLALMSAATFSSNIETATHPEAPKTAADIGTVAPLDPNVDNGPVPKVDPDVHEVFSTQFGRRGKHEVTVRMSATGYYSAHWRDGKTEEGLGTYNRTRTVEGGFPLALIAVNGGAGRIVTCSITIDGIEKDRQTTSAKTSLIFCEG